MANGIINQPYTGDWTKIITDTTGSVQKSHALGDLKTLYVLVKYGGTGLHSQCIIPTALIGTQLDVMFGYSIGQAQIRLIKSGDNFTAQIYNVKYANNDVTSTSVWSIYGL